MSAIQLILGNQLFPLTHLPNNDCPIVMIEHESLCTHFKYHKHKIIFFLSAMRHYKVELERQGFTVHYYELRLDAPSFMDCIKTLVPHVSTIHYFEIEDHFFSNDFHQWCNENHVSTHAIQSPMFLTTHDQFNHYLSPSKRPFMKIFFFY